MEHEVTYTFSRALHMMRYGGKKMKPISWGGEKSYFLGVVNKQLLEAKHNGEVVGDANLKSHEIMGSWIEVKE